MPRGVFSDRVNWFMSAVKEGGRLRAWAEARKRRRRNISNLVIMFSAGMLVSVRSPQPGDFTSLTWWGQVLFVSPLTGQTDW